MIFIELTLWAQRHASRSRRIRAYSAPAFRPLHESPNTIIQLFSRHHDTALEMDGAFSGIEG